MTVLDNLHPASFKGFEFLFLNESTSSGKKTVSHEYPNSNRRFTEELGEIPQKFLMRAVIYGTIEKRVSFESILNSEGLGQLKHPIYGVIDNVMSTTYTVDSSQKEVGIFNFNLNFEVSSTDFIHVVTSISEQSITENSADAQEEIYDDFSGSYVEPEIPSAFDAAVSAVSDAFETIKTNIKNVVNPIQEASDEFNTVIDNAITNINSIVQQAEILKNTFSSVYNSVLNLVDSPNKLENFWNSLLDYKSVLGVPISNVLKRNTGKRIKIANNTAIIQEQVRMVALTGIYESIAYKELKTSDEVSAAKKFLDEQYDIIINSNVIPEDEVNGDVILLANNLNTRNKFATLRNNTITILNNKLVNSWNVESINSPLTSFSLLSHRYYNNIDNINTLINLNEDLNSAGLQHNVDILMGK